MLCPSCARDDTLEVIPIMADDETPQLLLRCHDHEPPVEQVIDDPDAAPPHRTGSSGKHRDQPLVQQLGLYDKLADVVAQFDHPVEYGVVEHHFAYEYPDDYRELYAEFGHVHKDGARRYSLSSYLSRLLGNLTRQDRVAHHPSHGSGSWSYNGDLSAWSPTGPQRDRPIQSWQDWAAESGLDPHGWPAVELLSTTADSNE